MSYEQTLDQVDKLSLKGSYKEAEAVAELNYPPLFNPEENQNLLELIETNKMKRGEL